LSAVEIKGEALKTIGIGLDDDFKAIGEILVVVESVRDG